MSEYVFDNSGDQTPSRFAALETLFDPGTFRHLDEVGVAPGWRCLEVGGGSGSVARWLGQRVGSSGQVVVTDIDPRHLGEFSEANVEVRQHDIVNDPLEQDHFDLAHTRLVLLHIPQREQAIKRILSSLRPGGWVLFEEFDSESMKPDPAVSPLETSLKTLEVLRRVMADRGVDMYFGRLMPGVLEANGCTNVSAEGRVFLFRGGSAGADMFRANSHQMHDALVSSGHLTKDEFQADIARLDDPSVMWPSSVMWAVRGQRPSR